MSEQTPESNAGVYPSWWVLVLRDWQNSGARVTVHLRGGQSLGPGLVSRVASARSGESSQLTSIGGGHEQAWDFDLTDVAAVVAEARR